MPWIDFFKRLFRRPDQEPPKNGFSSPEVLQQIMAQVEKTEAVELSCDEVLALLDQFTEMAMRGEDVSQLMPLVQHHLDMCMDCQEEYQALLRILRGTQS